MSLRLGLRAKTVAILGGTLALAAASSVVASRLFFQKRIDQLEVAAAEEAAGSLAALIRDDAEQLDVLALDWSCWTDTWEYVARRSAEYEEVNLLPESLRGILALSSFTLLDADGATVFATEDDGPVRRWIGARFGGAPPPERRGLRGVVAAGGAYHLLAARPITQSDGSGPVRGTLVMTREVDAKRLARYGRIGGHDADIIDLEAGAGLRGHDWRSVGGGMVKLDGAAIQAVYPLFDPDGAPAALASTRMRRTSKSAGFGGLFLVFPALILVIAGLGMLSVFLFEAAVLGRMRSLGRELSLIASGERPGAKLAISGGDELSDLAAAMNGTLDTLYALIRERDAALREIHHRVKNNLQVIASLLALQADRPRAEGEAGALLASRRRVLSMAFVHEELYAEGDVETVELASLLARLVMACRQSQEDGGRIATRVECGDISLDLERAVPVGLIVGEALANSFLHAFPDGRAGTVVISAEARGEALSLRVQDDGAGLGDAPGRGLGSDVIEALAAQLGGRWSLGAGPVGGTIFELDIPPPPFRQGRLA